MTSMIADTGTGRRTSGRRTSGRSVDPRLFWLLVGVGSAAVAAFVVQAVLDPTMLHLIDLTAYRIAAERVLEGVSLYDSPLIGTTKGVFEFVYPPFAALVFLPITVVHGLAYVLVGTLINVGLLLAITWASLRALGYRSSGRLLVVALALSGVLLWCQPIRETVTFGQVNLLLALLVLVDLLAPASARWKGVLLGIAVGIKLTPAFFVAYLLITRQFRAAAVAIGSFVATVIVGTLFLPSDSVTFWSGAFVDPARIGVPDHPGNQSLRGMVARLLGAGTGQSALWLVLAVGVAVAGLWLARSLWMSGRPLPAAILCAMTTTAVSPFSWVHHWVWMGPLLVYLLHLTVRHGRLGEWIGLGVATVICSYGPLELLIPEITNILAIPAWHHVEIAYQHAYIWLTIALLVAAALRLREDRPSGLSGRGSVSVPG